MRVLLFTYEFLPFSGGIATYCYELASALCQLKHQVTIVALKTGEVDTLPFPFAIKWIDATPRSGLKIRAFKTLYSAVTAFNPDVLLATEGSALTLTSVFRFLTKTHCIPLIYGSEIIRHADRHSPYRRIVAAVMSRFYTRAPRVICISNYTRRLLLHAFPVPPGNAVVVYGGIKNRFQGSDHFPNRVRRRWAIPLRSPVLLTLARLTPRKGQDTIIRALPTIIARLPEVVYLCAGAGDYRGSLESLALAIGVRSCVIFTGRVPEEQKYEYYAACDIFVMPSREDRDGVEGFGLSFLEAWHASKPVIGSTHGGVSELIDHGINGLTVDPNDANAVAEGAVSLLTAPSRARLMGRKGFEKATKQLTDVRMAERIIGALK